MKRVLLTGATGFVGSRLVQAYKNCWQLDAPNREQLDLTNRAQIHEYVTQSMPELVIHTAAISNTQYCEAHPLDSFLLNVQLPERLAKECEAIGAKLVFFSSDQVYNGTRTAGPLPEDALLAPITVYGRHKLQAEQRVLELCPDAVCLRATWMYDFERPNLKNNTGFWGNLQAVLQQKKTLQLAGREHRGITWVMQVVQAMEQMTQLPGGVYNMGARNPLNTYATGLMCLERMGAEESAMALLQPDTERWPQFERNLSMDTDKLKRACGVDFGDTVDSFAACLTAWNKEKGGTEL